MDIIKFVTQIAVSNPYYHKIQNLFSSSLIGLWKLDEPAGTIAYDYSGRGLNGAHSNTTMGQPTIGGKTLSSKFVIASNSHVNIYSAGFASAFNAAEGTLQFIFKAPDAAYWTEALSKRMLTMAADANNRITFSFTSGVNNALTFAYTAGGTAKTSTIAVSSVIPIVITLTWSKSNDRIRTYLNAAKQGADVTALGTWVGALASTTTVIGAASTSGTFGTSGWMSNVFMINREATQAEITAAMPPLP